MSPSTLVVPVELGDRAYPIEIGTGNLTDIPRLVSLRRAATHAVIVTDGHLASTHAATIQTALEGAGLRVDCLTIEPGESSKSITVVERLWEQMLARGTDRKSVVVAVGGGVVGDVAGFVAASFARGLAFVQVPTSLLAQVDSSVGGKVGVNLPSAKNMIGAFWQPQGVLIDTRVLDTLPEREYRAGLAEVVKYGVILDAAFFAQLESQVESLNRRDDDTLRQIVAHSCRLKARVVTQDEREETGLRAVLNYGHTFGHAFEALTGYGQLLHGEAVSIGMIAASRLAERLGRIPESVTRRQLELLARLDLPTTPPPLDPDKVWESMSHDKKVEHGKLRFVLPKRLGEVELVSGVERADALAVLAELSR